jgi:subtilisin-like proprotein convertase family protein
MKAKLHFVLSITMFLLVFSVNAQHSSWKKVESIQNSEKLTKLHLNKNKVHFYELHMPSLKQAIASAPLKSFKQKNRATIINMPIGTETLEAFKIFEAPVFAPKLAAKYPNIKSYVGISLANPKIRLRMSVSPYGVQSMISHTDKSTVFMQPLEKGSNQYILYHKKGKDKSLETFKCNTIEEFEKNFKSSQTQKINEGGANNQELQKFRIAISVTGEYTAYHGGTVAGALAGINATLSRINEVFETDMAVSFELIANNDQIIYTNPTTDPYSNENNLENWNIELQNTLTNTIGNSDYDIGHLFGGDGDGGDAGCIGCVCVDDSASSSDINKGGGYTSPAYGIPEGDTFDLNYVAHEIGHQMGANHTWAYASEGTGVNSEPGSGSTIMAYAGIVDIDDIQINSDDYFHYHSIRQILANLTTKSCQTTEGINNNPPVANSGSDYTIPQGTPYVLKGSATDPDGTDNLTYCWEQIDDGIVNSGNFSSTLTNGSINRSLPPSSSPDRFIPNLKSVLNNRLTETNPGVGSAWESVSTVSRSLNWALTVRDRNPLTAMSNAQTSYATMAINVDGNSGPFVVTSQDITDINWTPGNRETITWNVANTNSGTINTSAVNILLSTDGGLTFPTILAANTPNDGLQDIIVPFLFAPFCRIKVEPVDNIYYAINSETFAINYTIDTTCPSPYDSSQNLNLSITDGIETSHTINVPDNGIISEVKVTLDVSHTYLDDLVITLTHPNGTTASTLWNRNCSSENDINITFEDWANNINCSLTNSGNTYAPASLLDVFNGLDAAGDWMLTINDLIPADNGQLNSWSLDICTQSTAITNPNIVEDIEGIKVFPNPNTGDFWVAFRPESNEAINIGLFDIRGRLIFDRNYTNLGGIFREELKTYGLKTGMYILTISDGNIETKRKIIIK